MNMQVLDKGMFKRLIVSAPWGNYIQPGGATATLGTYTAMARGGRVWRIIKTLRYYWRLKGWVNKIGLRNPGLGWLSQRVADGKIDVSDKIVSIHGFSRDQWVWLLDEIKKIGPLAVELDLSCPNVGEINWPDDLFELAVGTGICVVVKLPPVNYQLMFQQSHEAGVRAYHCCNTLPVPGGGLSGDPLRPVAVQCVRDIRSRVVKDAQAEMIIIGGGGIREARHMDEYIDAGVTHVALGTKLFNPIYLLTDRPLRGLIEYAEKMLANR